MMEEKEWRERREKRAHENNEKQSIKSGPLSLVTTSSRLFSLSFLLLFCNKHKSLLFQLRQAANSEALRI